MYRDLKIQQDYSRREGRHLRCMRVERRRAEPDDVVAAAAVTAIMIYIGEEIKSDYVDDMSTHSSHRQKSRPARS